MRRIPVTMATQHPDNASIPYWKKDNSPFVSAHDELEECFHSFEDLKVDEFMWDFDGKFADESVIDKLFSKYFEFFKKYQLGKDVYLTFRLPNVWQEKGYSLIRALMVILTAEDFAGDIGFKNRPLFEVILPMTERAGQLMYIQEAFRKLARFKSETFDHRSNRNNDYVEVIPLVEGVEEQIGIRKLLEEYVTLHRSSFEKNPVYIRPFLARSDPALLSGLVPNVLANKIALSEIESWSKEAKIPTYPIIGAGSLTFRGGLSPLRVKQFVLQYAGVRTVTLQSAFRYEHAPKIVKGALAFLEKEIPKAKTVHISAEDKEKPRIIIAKFSTIYRSTLDEIVPTMRSIFGVVPKRRERRLHIDLLAYKRQVGKTELPRAINFTAASYSLGVPAEFYGTGRALASLTTEESSLLLKYYPFLKTDLEEAGRFLNNENLALLSKESSAWKGVQEDVAALEAFFGMTFHPVTKSQKLHEHLTSALLLERGNDAEVARLIVETGKLRKALG